LLLLRGLENCRAHLLRGASSLALNAARHQDASRYSNGMPDSALKLLTFWGVWAMIFVLPMCVVGTIASLTMKGDYKTITHTFGCRP